MTETNHDVTFVVKVRVPDSPDQRTIDRAAHFVSLHLNRGFGMDRIELWHDGRRLVFDQEHDVEHYSSNVPLRWTERVSVPMANGSTTDD